MKVIDTSVLVDLDRRTQEEKVEKLDSEGRHVISCVSVTEMFHGLRKQKIYEEEHLEMNDFLSRFNVKPVDWKVAKEASGIIHHLREEGKSLHDLHDVYIGATALKEELPVLTLNESHFTRIDGLEAINWKDY